MGKQSLPHPLRTRIVPIRIALALLLCVLSPSSLPAQTTSVSALTVPLVLPSAIVFDSAGNLYFAETGNHVIRKVDTSGNLTTIAGTGTQGFSGDTGPAISATLDSPQGLALDPANNLYLADTHNHRIRRLNLTTGLITTIAGSTPGYSGDGAPALSAQLNLPTALAIDASGNLYLADTANHRIRRIDATTGLITTIAGTGTQGYTGDGALALSAAIDSPTGIAIDASNNLYLADTHNHRIRKITSSTGLITTIAGTGLPGFSGDTAPASAATLALPHGLTVDAVGNLYLSDTANHRIRRIDATTGLITTVVGDGTQAFAGDNGPPTAASLDSPTATSLSPASSLTLSDTGNQRIRQVETQPAGGTITTIAGLGSTTPTALTLTAPSAIAYGTGQLTANLASSQATNPATGSITFLATTTAATKTLGIAPLLSNTATFSTTTLPAGAYSLTAIYSGDQTHPSTQSPPLALTITPQQLTATIAPIFVLYGQPIPNLPGTLTGVLPQDAASLTATFTTTATTGSPAGTYPITPRLTGPAAGNYRVAAPSTSLTITPAGTVITLSNLVATGTTGTTGSTLTLTVHVASTTTGTPTGSVTLLDGNSPLFTTPLSSSGDAVFLTSLLAQGSHTFTAVYDGSINFTPSVSAPRLITVGTGPPVTPDFALAATGSTTQTILSGSSASFTFAVQTQNNLSSPITLAASGLPNLATASFNPATLPPGATPNSFTMTIATPTTVAASSPSTHGLYQSFLAGLFLLCPLAGAALRRRKHTTATRLLLLAIASVTLTLATGCGARINADPQLTSPAKSYTITVTGTATSPTGSPLQHSATVTLTLNPAS
ncbi:NHL domain-containing protein [Tunturibacter empetritectus]|uniref:Sugar lactone lactonase YvrE n=1 Tax=Tunturiibacter lichenicola TaxID=2051959 RepID=A0A7W8JCH6_9BACT|nr:Ig-like domain repeat protein [Edaphobacter lichenicola]MBB5345314.1 sugar lactone lactonase YvrE [Edaphobacter lichenicola]